MNNTEKTRCCFVVSMFGYTLRQGILIICVTTIVISSIALLASITSISGIDDNNFTNRPVAAASLLFALYCCGIATYQILISALLLWKTLKSQVNVFSCSLWYISHLSITMFYGCFFIAMAIAYFCVKQYVHGFLILFAGIVYNGVFIYFCVVVNSYSYTINQIIYY